jgi:crotonobetainyl-CoA:carnitine CoA-transferase CaiB-like acyl-CoA transferase
MGTANHLSVPNQVFPTSDGSVVIIAPSDEMWQRCARALDAERLDRPEYATTADRQARRKELIDLIGAITRGLTSQELIERLGAVRVNVAKVHSVGEAADHPQLAGSGGVVEFEYAGERIKAVASPFRLLETPTTVRHRPPGLDEHREAILADYGIAAAEAAALAAEGAFGDPPAERRASA